MHRRVDVGRRRLRSALLVWLIRLLRSRVGISGPGTRGLLGLAVRRRWLVGLGLRRCGRLCGKRGSRLRRTGGETSSCACEGLPGEDGADWFAAEFDGSLRVEESADGARWVDGALVELVGEFVWVWAEVGELVEPLGDCARLFPR